MNFKTASKYIVEELNTIYSERESQNIAYLILEDITKLNSTERLVAIEQELTPHQIHSFENYLHQLKQHKPIQQILGYTWFSGNNFFVNEHVLIPRPETEELVELIVNENKNEFLNILDIGTGSGCIAISLKNKLPNSIISAIDVCSFALQVAHQNAEHLSTSIHLKQINFLNEDNWDALETYDIIVSNPPYIKQSEQVEMHQNVLQHEPHLALFVPDNDALLFYKKIALFAQTHLKKDGKIYIEINETLGRETAEVFSTKGYQTQIIKDMQGKERMIKAWETCII